MKTSAPRPRTSARATTPVRMAAKKSSNGNGHSSGNGSPHAVSSEVAKWLAKPKHNLIAGKWVPAASGKTFSVLNPAERFGNRPRSR